MMDESILRPGPTDKDADILQLQASIPAAVSNLKEIERPLHAHPYARRALRGGWTSAATGLAVCGFNSALVYLLIFLLPFQLYQHYAAVLPHFYQFPNASPLVVGIGWIILFQLFYVAFRICPVRPSRPAMTLLVIFPVFFSLILFFVYPFGANDIFDTIFRGHVFGNLGISPYITVPNNFPGDALLPYAWWKLDTGTYGPLWQLLSGAASRLVGADLWANVIAYKLLATAHFWGSIILVYLTLRRLRPEYATRGFLFFAWNPLMQFEMVANGHNDSVLVFWMLVAVYLLVRGRQLLALLALTAAILVKFTPVLLVPFFLVALWHSSRDKPLVERLGRIGVAFALMGALAILIYAPFGIESVLANASYMSRLGGLFHSSTAWMVNYAAQNIIGLNSPGTDQLVRNLLLLILLAAILWRTFKLFRGSPDAVRVREGVLESSFQILFLYLIFATPWFQPWHVTWLLAFAPFLTRFHIAERTALFCFTALGNYFVWFYRWPIGSPIADQAEQMIFWVVFIPPIVFSVMLWLYRIWAARDKNAAPGTRRAESI